MRHLPTRNHVLLLQSRQELSDGIKVDGVISYPAHGLSPSVKACTLHGYTMDASQHLDIHPNISAREPRTVSW